MLLALFSPATLVSRLVMSWQIGRDVRLIDDEASDPGFLTRQNRLFVGKAPVDEVS